MQLNYKLQDQLAISHWLPLAINCSLSLLRIGLSIVNSARFSRSAGHSKTQLKTHMTKSKNDGAPTPLSLYPRSIDDIYEWRSARRWWYKAMRKGAGKICVWEKRYNMCYSTQLWRNELLLDLASVIAPWPWLLKETWHVIVSGAGGVTCNGTPLLP